MASNAAEQDSLKDELRNVLEESRMVIPGVQALFGFQTMAVFNNRFEDLSSAGLTTYLAGLVMLAISIALLMAPAAFHRMSERGQVSRELIDLGSRLLTWGMLPLAIGLALDIHVVLLAALDDERVALGGGLAALLLFLVLWFVLPAMRRRPGAAGSARFRRQ
jgi:uncharacterized membrane protein YczE